MTNTSENTQPPAFSRAAQEFLKARGVLDTLLVLSQAERPLSIQEMTNALVAAGSYYNAYLRVSKSLLRLGFVEFILDENAQRRIQITETGMSFYQDLVAICKKLDVLEI